VVNNVEPAPRIRTPDQRLRVFISSTLGELVDERAAARRAVDELRLVPVMFELGARPHPPRDLYRAYLAQSQVFVGIYWERYGWIAPDMEISGLEDEYVLASEHPKLIYIKSPAPDRDPELEHLLDRIRDDNHASYRTFSTAEELGELLENDLAVMLTERFEASVDHRLAGSTDPSASSHGTTVDPLPLEPSLFVGRSDEVDEILTMLRGGECRLVTITGPGGCGKTRLAVRLAEIARDQMNQRVCFVDLTGVRDPKLVLSTIATAVGVRDVGSRRLVDAITALLREAPRLLVIDNFEHVIEAASDLAEILAATSDVQMLVTSREALRLRWEQEFPLHPLAVPGRGRDTSAEVLADVAAVELFVERARRARPMFELNDANAGEVAEICRRLDGLPLAIELAAARMRFLSPRDLLARLEHRLDALSGGSLDAPDRHRALREAIAWSYDLLTTQEQAVFRRIAVFAGGCTLDAIEAVCSATADAPRTDPDELLDVVGSLVDKSLVVSAVDTTTMHTRFTLLETVREFGLEQLATTQEEHDVRARHLQSCHQLARAAFDGMRGPEMTAWLDVLDREHDNLRAAMDFALTSHHCAEGLDMATCVRDFWDVRGHYREGIARLVALLDATADEPTILRARAQDAVGWLHGMTGDYPTALEWHRQGLADSRATGDPETIGWSTCEQGIVACNVELLDEATALLDESQAVAAALGDDFMAAWSGFGVAEVALMKGDVETAVRGFEEVLEIARGLGQQWGVAWALATTGAWHVAVGDGERARSELHECLELRQQLRDDRGTADTLGLMACLASAEGAFEWSARLHGAAEIGQQANAVTIWPFFQPLQDASVQRLREALGPSRLDQLWREARAIPMHQIVAEALDGGRSAQPA
jgi:predicted ATPase